MASGDDTTTLWLPNSAMRERATVPGMKPENLRYLDGFFQKDKDFRYVDNMDDGRRVAEVFPHAMRRIVDGYACAECLALFNRRFDTCPMCGHTRDLERDIVNWEPDYWKDGPSRTSDEIGSNGLGA